MKKTMHTLLAMVFVAVLPAYGELSRPVQRKLFQSSPCLLAFSPKNAKDSVVYCILAKRKARRQECVLTGYDAAKEVFVSIPQGDRSVKDSCYASGLGALLKRNFHGAYSVRAYMLENTDLVFAGSEEFADLYSPTSSRQGIPTAASAGEKSMDEPVGGGDGGERSGLESAAMVAPLTTVQVFYATDRKQTGTNADPDTVFSNDRSDKGVMTYGLADVNIPAVHQKGLLEEPSIYSFEFSNDPDKHIFLTRVIQQEKENFFRQIQQKVGGSKNSEAFVFVHGYNVTFKDAVRRTAQMAYDLNFDGAPILYSWPSGESLWQYSVAEGNAEWTYRHLKQFLQDVAAKSGAKRVHLIAHSMGNRPLAEALSAIAPQKLFQQVILAAPDIDTEVFAQIEEQVRGTAARVTIYASENDEALRASQKMHAYHRLGQGGANIYVSSKADSVETSQVDVSTLGHSYYGDSEPVLQDLAMLLKRDILPAKRPRLSPVLRGLDKFWQMIKAQP